MPQHGPANNRHNLPQEPFVPSFFDQFQSAFGVDNERTRQLASLRAQGEQSLADQAPQAPRGGTPGGPFSFFNDFPRELGENYDAFINNLQNQFRGFSFNNNPTDRRVDAQLERAGVPNPRSAPQFAPPPVSAQDLQRFGQ